MENFIVACLNGLTIFTSVLFAVSQYFNNRHKEVYGEVERRLENLNFLDGKKRKLPADKKELIEKANKNIENLKTIKLIDLTWMIVILYLGFLFIALAYIGFLSEPLDISAIWVRRGLKSYLFCIVIFGFVQLYLLRLMRHEKKRTLLEVEHANAITRYIKTFIN